MAQQTVQVRLTGISPWLMTRYPIEDYAPYRNKEGVLVNPVKPGKVEDPQKAFEKLQYRDPAGNIYIPATQIRAALVAAATQIKKGKGTYSATMGSGAVLIEREQLEIPKDQQAISVHSTSGVNINTKGRIVLTRPMLENWSTTFEVNFDDELIEEQVLRTAFDIAGQRYGIGAWRPAKKGSFGRFRVDEFTRIGATAA